MAHNNGSAFAGLSANTPFYNILLAVAMWFGRFWIVPVLAMAGALAAERRVPASGGTILLVGLSSRRWPCRAMRASMC